MRLYNLKKSLLCLALLTAFGIGFSACGGDDDHPTPTPPTNSGGGSQGDDPNDDPEDDNPTTASANFARGADISWVTELEGKGYKFYPRNSASPKELTQLLRDDCGVNAIRLRVWVNPDGGWNGLQDVLVKARRARDLGMPVMIDFHLSDSWADPGKQNAPAAWTGFTPQQTADAIGNHVHEVLAALHTEGIDVKWVQIGNETTSGMLWNLGGTMKDQNAGEFPRYLNAGYDAVKSVYPNANVIVHLDKGQANATYTWFFDLLKANGGKFDMIGMSLYPEVESGSGSTWTVRVDNQAVNNCISNIKALNSRYGKKIMLCEIGFHYTNETGASQTIQKFIDEFASADILDGIFYWEPEAPEQEGYKKGAFLNDRPTTALNPFVTLKQKVGK